MTLHHLKYILATLLAATALTACSSDDAIVDDGVAADTASYFMSMIIDTGEEQATRATTEGETQGTAADNYIDLNSLHIYLYTRATTSTYTDTWKVSNCDTLLRVSIDSLSRGKYRLVGKLVGDTQKNLAVNGFCIVVMANWDNWNVHPDVTNIGTLEFYQASSYLYPYSGTGATDAEKYYTPTAAKPLPMYGLKTVDVSTTPFVMGRVTDIGEVNLLRAMAKVVVTCSADDLTLADVQLTRCNNRGMCPPTYMYQNTVFPTSLYLSIPGDDTKGCTLPGITENLPFRKVTPTADDEKPYYEIYIPEYRNTTKTQSLRSLSAQAQSNTPVPTRISMKLADSEGTVGDKTYYLDFKEYTDVNMGAFGDEATTFDILRNHIYHYDVTGATNYTYVVKDWSRYEAPEIVFKGTAHTSRK
jgi:hypothetical protein